MSTLTITRGLPGSGKTTWAKTQPGVRVNRDDLRAMLHGGWTGQPEHEDRVTAVQHGAVAQLLSMGVDVIVDDTNLHDRHVDDLADIAIRLGCLIEIMDFRDIPLGVCIARDAARTNPVGEAVITSMWQRHLAPAAPAASDAAP